MRKTSRWLSFIPANRNAERVAFCFPFAGGGASYYRAWTTRLPPSIVLAPVQLPGREERLFDPPFDRIDPLVDAVSAELLPVLPERYVLFGHSMGAFIAYELAQALLAKGARMPQRLIVSGAPAPHRAAEIEPIFDLPDETFLPALERYGGLPREVLESPELLELLLPRLRADLAITGTYVYRERPPLPCPITAFGGDADATVRPDAVEAWREHTIRSFDANILPGGHFFLTDAVAHVLVRLDAALADS